MKKIISMLLVLTIVVTTLVGVMVVDVNAMQVTGGEGKDINTRTWNINMSIAKKQRTAMATGNWTVTPKQAADGVSVPYDLGRITQVPNLGKTYWHLKFKDIDYKDADNTNADNAAYARFRTDYTNPDLGVTNAEGADDLIPDILIADFNDIVGGTTEGEVTTYGDMIKYTFYAYTNNKDTEDFTILFAHPNSEIGSVNIPASLLYSENMIPHKVDVYVWSNSADKTVGGGGKEDPPKEAPPTEAVYFNVFVDGIQSVATNYAAETKANLFNATAFRAQFFLNFKPTTSTKNGGVYKFKGSDWYISHDGNKTHKRVTRANLDDDYFAEIKVKNTYTKKMADGVEFNVTNKKDNIKGVNADVDAALEDAVVTAAGTDRKAVIYNKYYTNPSSIFTGEKTNVKLVDRKTGAEVAPAEATGTMDNYLFMVNGVYVVPVAVADPLPYYKSSTVPFEVTEDKHQTTQTRVHFENYIDNVMDENLPALGGLRSGFLKYTSDPRGTFSFYNGNIKYNTNDGYYVINAPQVKLTDAKGYDKKLTLQFDIYMPEYVATSSNYARFVLGGHTDPAEERTNAPSYGQEFGEYICITTNGLKDSSFTRKRVMNIKGNAWNTITMVLDSTDTATDGKYDISLYVNGVLQQSYETDSKYKENAKERLCSLYLSRLYMPLYTSVAVMNYAWYVGDYTQYTTPVANGVIDSKKVTDAEIFVDEANGLISYNNAKDTDYSTLVAAMTAAGYQPVYNQVINTNLINDKYDEVDGELTNKVNEDGTRTVTGKLVKKWMDSPSTNVDVVATIDKNGFSTYAIKDNNIKKAVDNGNGTASITINSSFGNTASIQGVASTYEEIIAALAAEEPAREGRSLELVGFAVIETDKLPKVYTLVPSGLEIRGLTFNKDTKEAELSYRKLGTVEGDGITFQLVVAAYDKDDKLLELKSGEPKKIDSSTENGESAITFKPEFSATTLSKTKHYKVFMFDSLVYCNPLFKSAKINK